MEILNNLALGFSVAFSVNNILYCLLGTVIGTIVGVLPGLGPLATISMLLPLMYGLSDPVTSIIFLAGIYYGSQYGSSTTAILLKVPGETSSLITTIDGYRMTQNGRGGAALTIAALASFTAGTITTMVIALIGAPLASIAFAFGPTEYAALMIVGLVASVALVQGSILLGIGTVLVGVLLGTIGTDLNSGTLRFTFGEPTLLDGISFGVIAMGVFGLSEIIYNILHEPSTKVVVPQLRELYPTKEELSRSVAPTLRGTGIGTILGLLPGAGTILSSFASYVVEKKISRNPSKFGTGVPEGVAAPEAANNAGAQSGFVPMLSLGIPTTPVMALMIAALMINKIQPGPQVISSNPELFWGLIVSMWIGNLMLLILNVPLIGIWISLLKIPRILLYPAIAVICVFGTYYVNNNWFEVWLLVPFAIIGYVFKRLGCEPAPMAIGFVIGSMLEEHLRRMLTINRGDWLVLFDSPISLTILIFGCIIVLFGIFFKRNIN